MRDVACCCLKKRIGVKISIMLWYRIRKKISLNTIFEIIFCILFSCFLYFAMSPKKRQGVTCRKKPEQSIPTDAGGATKNAPTDGSVDPIVDKFSLNKKNQAKNEKVVFSLSLSFHLHPLLSDEGKKETKRKHHLRETKATKQK